MQASHFGDVELDFDFDEASESFGDVCGEDAGRARGKLRADACRRERCKMRLMVDAGKVEKEMRDRAPICSQL